MSKLTLPILCAYLPHRLEIINTDGNRKYTLGFDHLKFLEDNIQRGTTHNKLLLRPLSSLTDEQIAELDSLHDFSVMNITQIKIAPMRYPYPIVQKLIEWHFDVFGGIEAGWALPLNDHEN